jgi:L-ascorbate metabolism protein UlaG (beta-lactamase superfamily)
VGSNPTLSATYRKLSQIVAVENNTHYTSSMIITKYGHCCLLIEENDTRILTDPGKFTTAQNEALNVDVLIVTHEHGDHFHIDSVKKILANNPSIVVVTNSAVGTLLAKENIAYTCVEEGQTTTIKNVMVEGSGSTHAVIDPTMPGVLNTGYFIGERLFYPGDSFHVPGRIVDVLALPTAGPWMKFSEAITYARTVKPKTCFPVHDGILVYPEMMNPQYQRILEQFGITFMDLAINTPTEL